MTREFEVGIKLTADGKALVGESRAAKEALGGLGDTARKTGGDLGETSRQSDVLEASTARLKLGLAAATATLGAFAASSVSSSLEFSKSIRAISTQLDDGTDQVKAFEEASKSLAVQFGTLPIEQSKAFYEILSSGITDTTKATDLLIEANKLAIGGNADLQATIDGLTSIMKGYGDKIADVKNVSDAFFVSSLAGKISIEELASGLGRVVPLAEILGVSFDELSAATAALTTGGIAASESITGVRAVLAAIAKPSSEAAKLAQELGLEFNAAALQSKGFAGFLEDLKQKTGGNADALAILFGGVEAFIPAVALAGNAGKEFNAIMDQMADKTGAAQRAFDKMADPSDKFKELMAAINTVALRLGNTLTNVLAPAAGMAADAINSLFGTKQTSAIDQQKQKIAELGEQIASIKDKLHFPGYEELFFDKAEFDRLVKSHEDAQADLFKLQEAADGVTNSLKNETNALTNEHNALGIVTQSLKTNSEAKKATISDAERFVQALTKEVESIGKDAIELKRLEAAKLGVLAVAEPLIDALEAETKALEDQAKATRQHEENLRLIAQVTESVATSEEKYAARVQELDKLLAAGMGQETYNRALKQAEEQFLKTGKAGRDAFDEISQFSIQAQRNLQNALGDALFDGINGRFDDMVNGFKNAILRMLTEALAADIWGALFNKRTGNLAALASTFGFCGNATASSGGSGSGGIGLGDVANFGSSAMSLASMGSNAGTLFGSFSAGMTGGAQAASFIAAESATMGAGMAAQAGVMAGEFAATMAPIMASFAEIAAPVAALAAGFMGGTMIGGDKKLFGMNSMITSAIGTALLGPIGGILGGSLNALFGRGPLKQKETFIDAMVGTDGIESGALRTNFKAKGGTFVSDKRDFVSVDMVTNEFSTDNNKLSSYEESLTETSKAITKIINETTASVSRSLYSVADSLHISKQPLDDFSTQIQIASESGKQLTEEQISAELTRITDEMVNALVPGIAEFSRKGEDVLHTLSRLGAEFVSLEGAASLLSGSTSAATEAVSAMSFDQRSRLVQQVGGTDKLNQQLSFFSENFMSQKEVNAISLELLNRELGKLGLSADMTKQQYADLIRSVTEVGGVSVETASKLLELAPAFLQIKNSSEQATTATYDLAAAEELIADKRSALIGAYHQEKSALESVVSRFKDLASNLRDASDSLSLGNLSPLTPQQRLDEARNQFNQDRLAANAGDEAALARLPESAQAFLEASQVYNASSAEYVSDFNFVQQVLESAAVTADTQATIAQQQLDVFNDAADKLGVIDNHVVDVKTAFEQYAQAVLTGLGNLAISDQEIRDYISTHTIEDSIYAAVKNNVSGSQIAGALGVDQSVVNQAAGGLSVSDQQILDYVLAEGRTSMDVYKFAINNGISSQRLSDVASGATGISLDQVNQFVKDNNLASFAVGTDLVPRDGLAMLHRGEAVTPSSTVTDIKEIRQKLEVDEGITNTSSIVNHLVEDNDSVANVKSITNQLVETNNSVANITSIVDRLAKVSEDRSISNRLSETIGSVTAITSAVNRSAEINDDSIVNRLTEVNDHRVNRLAENNDSVANDKVITSRLAETSDSVANVTSIVNRLAKVNEDKSSINRLSELNEHEISDRSINNLASFEVGTDLVPRDGLAMLHKGEAVTPSSTVIDIKTIKRLLEVNEGITNTASIVNLAENHESVANVKAITSRLAETSDSVANITSIVSRLAKVNEDKSSINRVTELNERKVNDRSISNLASFEVGTDLVPRDGLAMLHKGEAVTPSSTVTDIKEIRQRLDDQRISPIIYAPAPDIIHPGNVTRHQGETETTSSLVEEVKALRQELAELRREQNQQTSALVNVAIQSQKMNADMIIKGKQESDKTAAWREKAKAGIR